MSFLNLFCACACVCVDMRARICICFSKCYPLFEVLFDCVLHFTVFSNMLKDTQIHILADSDEQEVVQQVQVRLHLQTLLCLTWIFFYLSAWYLFHLRSLSS